MFMRFPGGTVVKNPPANAGNVGSIPVPGRPPGGRSGNPLPYSYLLIPMGWGTWQATVHGVAKSWSQLSNWTTTKDVYILIPGTWEYVNINGKKKKKTLQMESRFSSVQFSRSVLSNSLWPHESQHARPPCPSPTPGVHWDSRPLSQWCHPAISSSVIPFSSCPHPSQHQSLFQWVNSSHEVAKVLEF